MLRNKILKFIELLKEAHEEDETELNDILYELRDELIEFEIHKGYFSKQALDRGQIGEKVLSILHNKPIYDDDKFCFCIEIQLDQLKDTWTLGTRFGNRKLISDNKIFTIFRELDLISQRYGNCFVHISAGQIRFAIYLFILIDTEVDQTVTKFMQIFKEIKSRNSAAKSDFSHDTTVKLQDDKIVIETRGDSYTDRKFRNLIRGIDLSDYKIEKTELRLGLFNSQTTNTISKK